MKGIYNSDSPARLDKALREVFPEISRSQLKKYIESGFVTLNGVICKQASQVILPESEITLEALIHETSSLIPKDISFEILFEDDEMLVVNKPAGLTVHPGAGNREDTLVNALLFHFGKDFSVGAAGRPGIVHRLDKDTSGVMVVAKTQFAHTFLSTQFEKKIAQRKYIALLHSLPKSHDIFRTTDEGTISTLLTRDDRNRLKFKVSEGKGRTAISHYKVLERAEYAVLTQFLLATGRTHQIRVHAAFKKAPLIGDITYGRATEGLPQALALEVALFKRQALHAHVLICDHPRKKTQMEFKANIPSDMLRLFKHFGIIHAF